uniref:Uncharacterized protein n=1 Tax=Mycena chlorophos TaxID=658473 RepID=A0ABQ0L3I1_MYCCL|nr:predicted protein [Mycena chlorophos]
MALLSSYSSFFRSGLLSPTLSSQTSLYSESRDSFELESSPRRSSLPTESSRPTPFEDEEFAFYFTLQPRRDSHEYRSFLSLDLAESLSMRSNSMKRKHSSRRGQRPSRELSTAGLQQLPDSPNLLPPPSPFSPRTPTSARSIPTSKPAPAAKLPEVPLLLSPKMVRLQAPPGPKRKPSVLSSMTRDSATSSTVSTRYRLKRRSKALAALEGRRRQPPPSSFAPVATDNFMSLSDDEDDQPDDFFDPVSPPAPNPFPVEDLDFSLSDDQLIMLIARLEDGDLRSAPSPPHSRQSSAYNPHSRQHSSSGSEKSKSRFMPTLGFESFMDFHNDDDSSGWSSWRGVVEVAS